MDKILLHSGKIIDGTGSRSYNGHVLIEGDRIKDVLRHDEPLPNADVAIDVSGCAIAPGFIDAHSHLEGMLVLNSRQKLLKCQLEQGITTIVGGNCGFSPAPVRVKPAAMNASPVAATTDVTGPVKPKIRSMQEFLETVERSKPIVNLIQLVGHGTVRITVTDDHRSLLEPDELHACLESVQRSFDEGACGLSFGLGYTPGLYTPDEEIETFCALAARNDKPITVHLRTYSRWSGVYPLTQEEPHNVRALREMIAIARRTGAVLHISHFKLLLHNTWPLIDQCMQIIDDARNDMDIMFDAIPYPDVNGIVDAIMPPWFLAELPAAYKDTEMRKRALTELNESFKRAEYTADKLQLMDAGIKGWEHLSGLSIPEIADRRGTQPWETLIDLSELSNGRAALIYHDIIGDTITDKPLDVILSYKQCMIGSDVLIRDKGYPNPAAFGLFPRVLGRYSREKKLFSLEEAVRKMTSASTERFGIKDRGILAAGKAADIVVFDPETIAEGKPTASQPATRPIGIQHVFLNGTHVVKDGAYVDSIRAGRVLRT